MRSLPFYLLLTISIVSKSANAYVLNESVSMNNEYKSQTDEKQSALFDGIISSSSRIARNTNDADNQIRTSTSNATGIDSSIDVPQPNDATIDATTYQTSRESRNTLDEVETGTVHSFSHSLLTTLSERKEVLQSMIQIKCEDTYTLQHSSPHWSFCLFVPFPFPSDWHPLNKG